MEPLQLPTLKDNTADRSADQTEALPLNRVAYATGLAQAAFGYFYAPPTRADFCDRSPDEVRAARERVGVGVAR